MSTATSTEAARSHKMVRLPIFELLPTRILRAIEHAASSELSATGEAGELFATRVQKTAIAEVADDAYCVVPLRAPEETETLDYDFMASSSHIFFKLRGKPQTIMTYAFTIAFSEDVHDPPSDIDNTVKFPSPTHLLVATGDLLHALSGPTMAVNLADTLADSTVKRQCLRQLDEEGDLSEVREDKGMLKYILDLEGVRHHTRVKTDIPAREKQLWFAFRAMEPDRWS